MRYFIALITSVLILFANNALAAECDDIHTKAEKAKFQTLYKNNSYDDAYAHLNSYIKKCQKEIEPIKLLWMRNDLALAAQKAGNPKQCLEIISDIEHHTYFSTASETFKKAIKFNYTLCQSDLANPGKLEQAKGNKEFAWLFNSALTNKEKHELFATLLSEMVPQDTPVIQFTDNFKKELIASLKPPVITDGRYGISSAPLAHDPDKQGFIWVDTKEGTSIVGVIGRDYRFISFTSKFYNQDTYPDKAKQDIKNLSLKILADWHESPSTKKISIYDPEAKEGIVTPFLWFDEKFTYLNKPEPTRYDEPETKIVTDLGPSLGTPSQHGKLTCSVYPTFAVLELYQGLSGSEISVNYRKKTTKIPDLCKEFFSGRKQLFRDMSVFHGVVGNILFMSNGIEPFGVINDMTLFDATSGKKITSLKYNYEKNFEIQTIQGKVKITFYQPMKTVCNPTPENPECWTKIMKENRVSSNIKISAPDCSHAYESYPEIKSDYPDGSGLTITTKVSIADIIQPNVEFVGGDATCTCVP